MYNVGIIGCGDIAGYADDDLKKRHIYTHAKAIKSLKGFRLIACCDNDPDKLSDFSKKWDIPHSYLYVSELFSQEDFDILVIASPTEYHVTHLKLALNSKVKAIFCEKPFTSDLRSGIDLMDSIRNSDKVICINFMRRWDLFYQKCKKIIDSGELGRIETIVAYVDTALYMNSIHMIDMLIYFGGDILSCSGFLDRINAPRIVHGKKDYGGKATLLHKNGIISFLKASGESRQNHFFEIDIQGTKGRLRILDDDKKYQVYKFEESTQHRGLLELSLNREEVNLNNHERVVEAYLEIAKCIENGGDTKSTPFNSLKSLDIIELIYQSDKQNHNHVISKLLEYTY